MDSIKSEIYKLRGNSIAYLASVNEKGFPQIKAMMVLEHESIKTHFFSTNKSSGRVTQFLKNPKASVYYCETAGGVKGALFTGIIEVCTDHDTKALLWNDNSWKYYSKGIDDEDYCVYKFTAETVNYYQSQKNTTFLIEDLL